MSMVPRGVRRLRRRVRCRLHGHDLQSVLDAAAAVGVARRCYRCNRTVTDGSDAARATR